MRRLLAHAFSNSALAEQEELIEGSTDALIQVIRSGIGGVVDIADLFERLAFDIIGDLAFGETFGALRTGERTNLKISV